MVSFPQNHDSLLTVSWYEVPVMPPFLRGSRTVSASYSKGLKMVPPAAPVLASALLKTGVRLMLKGCLPNYVYSRPTRGFSLRGDGLRGAQRTAEVTARLLKTQSFRD
ncbi:hypothetical protein MUG91_G110n126 [Manis pentadactyla]|nr:hypothetical protein MUG91_G110n126 [Manis pentadactyla]